MVTFTKYELELIYKGLKSFINLRTEILQLLDIKEETNKKHNEFIDLMNKTTDAYNKMR